MANSDFTYVDAPIFKNFKAGEYADQSFLMATLHAVLLNFKQVLNISPEISLTDYVKSQWKLHKNISYPRSYLALNNFEVLRDRCNTLAVRQNGFKSLKVQETGNQVAIAKTFPVQLSLELHYFDSDMNRAIMFLENLAILSSSHSFVFSICVQDQFEFQSKIAFTDSISIPTLDLGNDSDPGSIELVFSFTVDSYIGKVEKTTRAFDLAGATTRATKHPHLDAPQWVVGSNT